MKNSFKQYLNISAEKRGRKLVYHENKNERGTKCEGERERRCLKDFNKWVKDNKMETQFKREHKWKNKLKWTQIEIL